MISTVVFDLDDTLFPEYQFVLSGLRSIDQEVRTLFGRTGFYESAKAIYTTGRRGNIIDLALAELGVDKEPGLVQKLVAVYREHRPEIHLHEDARWAIDFSRARFKLGLLTDGYLVTQQNKVDALGIAPFFDVILYSDQYGRENWKPSEVPYRALMNHLKCPGEACVYIADNPAKDFVTARRLSWQTVRIRREFGEYSRLTARPGYEANRDIETLFELEDLISRL